MFSKSLFVKKWNETNSPTTFFGTKYVVSGIYYFGTYYFFYGLL